MNKLGCLCRIGFVHGQVDFFFSIIFSYERLNLFVNNCFCLWKKKLLVNERDLLWAKGFVYLRNGLLGMHGVGCWPKSVAGSLKRFVSKWIRLLNHVVTWKKSVACGREALFLHTIGCFWKEGFSICERFGLFEDGRTCLLLKSFIRERNIFCWSEIFWWKYRVVNVRKRLLFNVLFQSPAPVCKQKVSLCTSETSILRYVPDESFCFF